MKCSWCLRQPVSEIDLKAISSQQTRVGCHATWHASAAITCIHASIPCYLHLSTLPLLHPDHMPSALLAKLQKPISYRSMRCFCWEYNRGTADTMLETDSFEPCPYNAVLQTSDHALSARHVTLVHGILTCC